MSSTVQPNPPRRHFLRFSLRTLLIVVTLACVGLGLLMERAARQRRALEVVHKFGGHVAYRHEFDEQNSFVKNSSPPEPAWLRRLLGQDCFQTIVQLHLKDGEQTAGAVSPRDITEADWAALGKLNALHTLTIFGFPLRDEHLQQWQGLENLTAILLNDTQITDAAFATIGRAKRMQVIRVEHRPGGPEPVQYDAVTGEGLRHLQHMPDLHMLALSGMRITDENLPHIRTLSGLKTLFLDCAAISDDALYNLEGLGQLRWLGLNATPISDNGLTHLSGLKLTQLSLQHTHITDAGLVHLHSLPMKYLRVEHTSVTPEGLGRFTTATGSEARGPGNTYQNGSGPLVIIPTQSVGSSP